jgi:hypothetical protein
LPHFVGLFDGFVADVAGLDATTLGAFLARHPGAVSTTGGSPAG